METRKVIIVNNRTQSQKAINSTATTLGELKAEAIAAGLNIEGMTWYEGHLRAELIDDASQLPATVMWKGRETTELTFLLTQPDKKVKSGIDRAEVYNRIRNLGLQEVCKRTLGRNYTQCSTNDLLHLIEGAGDCGHAECPSCDSSPLVEVHIFDSQANLAEALKELVNTLYEDDYLGDIAYERIMNLIECKEEELAMSKEEIDSMFDFVDK